MAVCDICNREMNEAKGCAVVHHILEGGVKIKPVLAGDDQWVEPGERCSDCGAMHGHPHHTGCDVERCGNCGGQFISCDCDYTGEVEILVLKEDKE